MNQILFTISIFLQLFPLISPGHAAATPLAADTVTVARTFCNPLNFDYGWSAKGHRHGADPVIVLFKDRYFLFDTDDLPGYRMSEDLITWTNIPFAPELFPMMSDNKRGTYCAPAVAADKTHIYFIRMSRSKTESIVPVMRTADPASGKWEKCGELRVTGDPALFLDDDGRAWLYHGLGKPTKVFQIDTKTWTEIPGSEVQLRPSITNVNEFTGGYERGRRELVAEVDTKSWLDKFTMPPCQEAAWMTKFNNRYYLQYSTPGTVSHWYCDVVLEGTTPTGPFKQVDYAPASLKVGGFMGSAGHSCVFQDKHGNYWRITTMWVGVNDLFERRLGLFPVGFDAEGRMFTETAMGDYPQIMPDSPRKSSCLLAGWRVLSCNRKTTASSSLAQHPSELASDEDCRTWWSAATGNAGEWFQMDLGAEYPIHAVQVNFAEQDCNVKSIRPGENQIRYQLQLSTDAKQWRSVSHNGSQSRTSKGPHNYLDLGTPQNARYLKVINEITPAEGKFALRDLRVFGNANGQPPQPATHLKILRHKNDDRNATITWTPSKNADGYIVRFGVAPDRLHLNIQLQGGNHTKLTTHILNRGGNYFWRVDAFNASGTAPSQIAQ